MTFTSPSRVRERLHELDFHPSRRLGQNFLVDANILSILVAAADLQADDHVFEVGPGLGVLSGELLARVGRVTAVEKDRRLFEALTELLPAGPALRLECADVMDLDLAAWLAGVTKVVANLPYGVASRLLIDLSRSAPPPPLVVVTIQDEVAGRLAAAPGSKAYGLLSVWVQLVYDVAVVKRISPTCFWPKPEIWSAIVKLTRRAPVDVTAAERETFYRVTKYAFAHRRKQIRTLLAGLPDPYRRTGAAAQAVLDQAGIPAQTRPEALDLPAWLRLAGALNRP